MRMATTVITIVNVSFFLKMRFVDGFDKTHDLVRDKFKNAVKRLSISNMLNNY
jgi:hypothetical protein